METHDEWLEAAKESFSEKIATNNFVGMSELIYDVADRNKAEAERMWEDFRIAKEAYEEDKGFDYGKEIAKGTL